VKDAAYHPRETEVAQLMTLVQMPGYEILKKIYIAEVDQLQVDMMNADPTNEKEVLAKHNLALAAGMFYQRVSNKVAGYIQEFGDRKKAQDVQPDQTAELFS
jgi:hypothetical protein